MEVGIDISSLTAHRNWQPKHESIDDELERFNNPMNSRN